jgi:hypothetical protein
LTKIPAGKYLRRSVPESHTMKARLAFAFALGFSLCGTARPAAADPLDPALERLISPDTAGCATATGAYVPNGTRANGGACKPDNAAFARLVNQYGFALAPSAMHSARTTGYGGFHLSIEATYSTISGNKDYWKYGTQGAVDPNTGGPSVMNTAPPSLVQQYSLKFRKGFGFGLELTGVVGFMPQTSILSGGADLRMSLLEGFRTGIGGVLPDVAVGAGVRTITGTEELQLTVMGLDAQISKPFPIASSSVLTPWIGYQYLFIWGDSGLIDFTPATDAIQACNYSGSNVPGNPDPNKVNSTTGQHVYDGSPVCRGGQANDFNNNGVFEPARLRRHRLLAGLDYRYEMVMVGGQFIMDLVPPADAQPRQTEKNYLQGEDKQFSFVLELGAMF